VNVIRFCVGPWKNRYSSNWRIWSNPNDDNIYLGVSALLKYLKISLHETGKFRAAFVEDYNEKLISDGKDESIDRAFMKWDKAPLIENEIRQVLDIHFPIDALSADVKPQSKKGKPVYFMVPDPNSIGDNDTVTVKVLFHKTHPEHQAIAKAFNMKRTIPGFWIELNSGEFASIAFQYSKILPINISKEKEEQGYAKLALDMLKSSGKNVGDSLHNLTFQKIDMGMPPTITNVGHVSVRWVAEKSISISIAKGV